MLKKCTSLLLAILMIFNISANAFADCSCPKNIDDKTFSELTEAYRGMYELATKSNDITDEALINKLIDLAYTEIEDGNVFLNATNGFLNYDKVKAIQTKEDDKIFNAISIPIEGEDYSLLSSITLLFDSNDNLATYTETLIMNEDGKFVIDIFMDGDLFTTKYTNISYVSNEEIQNGLDDLHDYANELREGKIYPTDTRRTDCIAAVLGVNVVVAALIGGTCAASCPAVVPICVACIGGVISLGAADVKAVVECFKL